MGLFGKKEETLRIFMRSGNVMIVDRVTDYEIKYRGDVITYLKVEQHKDAKYVLIVGATNLSQIEGIVKEAA